MPRGPRSAHQDWSLKDVDLFTEVPANDLRPLEERLRAVTIPKGTKCDLEPERRSGILLVAKGALRLYRLTPGGRRLDVAYVRSGTFVVGERILRNEVEAAEDTVVCFFSREDLQWVIERYPAVALKIIATLADRLATGDERQEMLAGWPLRSRLAFVLLQLEHNGLVEDIGHQGLADLMGAARESTTVILDDFAQKGWVEIGHRRIRITDREALRKAISP